MENVLICSLPSFKTFCDFISQKQEWPVVAMFIDGSEQNEHSL
jgi:hypothetical protein